MKKLLFCAVGLTVLLGALPVEASSGVRGYHRPHRWGRHWGWGAGWYGPYSYAYGGYYSPYGPYYRGGYVSFISPEWTAVDTDVSPEEARVYLDGRYIGTADDFDGYPDYLYLKRGRYRLEFRLAGYQSKSLELATRRGMKLEINEKLARVAGSRTSAGDEAVPAEGGVRRFWAKRQDVAEEITDEGEISGFTSRRQERDADIEREDDEDDEEETKEEERRDKWRDKRESDSRPGESRSKPEASPVRSRLRLAIEPTDAAVYLDDRFVGTAEEISSLDQGLSVSPGKHAVTVSRPGFKDKTIEIDIKESQTESLRITLVR